VSEHWKPQRQGEWTVIDGYAPGNGGRRGGGGVVPVVVSAVLIGLLIGGALTWTARHADSGPSSAIEWNAVQAVPTRAPDAEDVKWEKRASVLPSPSWGGSGGGEERTPSAADATGPPPTSPTRGEARNGDGSRAVSGQQIRVIDGDTFDLNGERVRVAGIDAPETHPSHCVEEARLGVAATQKLAELLRGRPLWISGLVTDRYDRSVRTVRVNGEDVADAMISAGLARNYDGKQRQGWC
jgi:endonuclease YncB( thermonuclease family)